MASTCRRNSDGVMAGHRRDGQQLCLRLHLGRFECAPLALEMHDPAKGFSPDMVRRWEGASIDFGLMQPNSGLP